MRHELFISYCQCHGCWWLNNVSLENMFVSVNFKGDPSYIVVVPIEMNSWYVEDIFLCNSSADSKDHGANMGPTWALSAPDGPHVGPMNLAIRECTAHTSPVRTRCGKSLWVPRLTNILILYLPCCISYYCQASILDVKTRARRLWICRGMTPKLQRSP